MGIIAWIILGLFVGLTVAASDGIKVGTHHGCGGSSGWESGRKMRPLSRPSATGTIRVFSCVVVACDRASG